MRVIVITFILNLSILTSLFGQDDSERQDVSLFDSISKVSWQCDIIALPTIIGSYESYEIRANTFKHKCVESKRIWKINYTKRKIHKKGNRKSTLTGLDYFLENYQRKTYSILMSEIDIARLRGMIEEKPYLNLNDSILNKYLILNKLEIKLDEFYTEYSKALDQLTSVIDGAVFIISLDLIDGKDTTNYLYQGNYFDGVEDTQVKNFLLYYDLKYKYDIFSNLWINQYFTDENLYGIILRYIAYKENTFERVLYDQKMRDYERDMYKVSPSPIKQ